MGRRETGIDFRPVDPFVDGEIPASDDGDGRRFSCLVGVRLDISQGPRGRLVNRCVRLGLADGLSRRPLVRRPSANGPLSGHADHRSWP